MEQTSTDMPALPAIPAETASAESPVMQLAREEEKKVLAVSAPQTEKAAPVRVPRTMSDLKKMLLSLNHIGMGKQRMMFIQSVALMLDAGLPLIDALKTQLMETNAKAMRTIIQGITTAVENGVPFWRAMDEQCFFSPYELALVRIGEEGGNLARNMQYLAEQQEKDRALKAKVKMAMIYPTIILIMVFVLVMGLGMFVLPNLVGVLTSLNVPLPFMTRVVIGFSKVFEKHGAIFVPLLLFALINFLLLGKFTRFRVVTQWLVFHIPGVGSLAREAIVAQFGVILGGLLKAGVPLIEAMKSLVDVTHIVAYRDFYRELLEHIGLGDSFTKSFEKIPASQKLMPVSVQQLIMTGEKSGSLSEVLMKIAEIYDKKASETAEKLPAILEPVLLLFIGGIVGGIAFAIIIPIYSVVGNIG
ncbi:MAG: type II secretion system F family protein [Candidatus Peribacteraceae bacterium]|nr:type II secretion system F family protein [Candidatus Peribacteraceae bacterium]